MIKQILKCPFNNFSECYEEQCPFYGVTKIEYDQKLQRTISVYGCKRVNVNSKGSERND